MRGDTLDDSLAKQCIRYWLGCGGERCAMLAHHHVQRAVATTSSYPAGRHPAAARRRPDDRGGLVRTEWGDCGDAGPAGKRMAFV